MLTRMLTIINAYKNNRNENMNMRNGVEKGKKIYSNQRTFSSVFGMKLDTAIKCP